MSGWDLRRILVWGVPGGLLFSWIGWLLFGGGDRAEIERHVEACRAGVFAGDLRPIWDRFSRVYDDGTYSVREGLPPSREGFRSAHPIDQLTASVREFERTDGGRVRTRIGGIAERREVRGPYRVEVEWIREEGEWRIVRLGRIEVLYGLDVWRSLDPLMDYLARRN